MQTSGIFEGDKVRFTLTPRAKFEKGRFLVGKVTKVGYRDVRVTSQTIRNRSKQSSIRVSIACCKIDKVNREKLNLKIKKQLKESMQL